jgi:hypothetical protein
VKKTYLLLATAMFVVFLLPGMAMALSDNPDVTPLSNKDILLMVESKMTADAIVKTIHDSACTFDTFPPVLQELKRRGVPDAVLLAMVEAPYGPSEHNNSADDLGEQAIYHYAEQLKQYLTPTAASRLRQSTRAVRTRAVRTRNAVNR